MFCLLVPEGVKIHVNKNNANNPNETTNLEAQVSTHGNPPNEWDGSEVATDAPAPAFANSENDAIPKKKREVKRKKMVARRNPEDSLLVNALEACNLLGGIHRRSLARLEERGLIRSVKLLRHKLYAMDDLKALVDRDRAWNAAGEEASK